ncbi:Hypothetical protein A7982_06942 [Minicystis rosea]|nr:Hypothetical protein A7982_06942 [Minicystis rosea]
MAVRPPATIALTTLLLASLALNVRLWTMRNASSAAQARARPAATEAPAAPAATARADNGACQRELEACQRRGWEVALRKIGEQHAEEKRPQTPAKPGAAGSTAQASALCRAAETHLRETWRRDRELLTNVLAHDLGDPAEQERAVARDVEAMRKAVGLAGRDGEVFERAYRDKRQARVTEARTAMARNPPDLGAAFDAARALYADEDALIAERVSPAARDTWRAQQVDTRTTMLAILASMADRDWDDSIRW